MAASISRPNPSSSASILLTRLEHVRQYGKSWRADCPRGHTSRGALSVTVGEDSRLLLHCFAGCAVHEIVSALGLEVADLFPPGERIESSPADRAQRRDLADTAHWRAALGVLATEATVMEVAGSMIERGDSLAAADMHRVRLATYRIHAAREVLQ